MADGRDACDVDRLARTARWQAGIGSWVEGRVGVSLESGIEDVPVERVPGGGHPAASGDRGWLEERMSEMCDSPRTDFEDLNDPRACTSPYSEGSSEKRC